MDHPRIRGEHLETNVNKTVAQGSSPHTRGAPPTDDRKRPNFGIIPAYAGSTFDSEFLWGPGTDHPRIRGEHLFVDEAPQRYLGSSPHTRGAHAHRPAHECRPWIIPAYAGSTANRRQEASEFWDHPRIRGEHVNRVGVDEGLQGSSPHTRGAHRSARSRGYHERIIPAYAGSTPTTSSKCPSNTDHPRIRGEHLRRTDRCPYLTGSSPHTRGALRLHRRHRARRRIIPAYAGSTEGRA